jgi:hypothetical protein
VVLGPARPRVLTWFHPVGDGSDSVKETAALSTELRAPDLIRVVCGRLREGKQPRDCQPLTHWGVNESQAVPLEEDVNGGRREPTDHASTAAR